MKLLVWQLQRDIDVEEAVIRSATPTIAILSDYNDNKLNEKWNDNTARLSIREVIRSIVDKIIVHKADKHYEVFFKNGHEPISVELFKKSCKINGMEFDYTK